MLVANFGFTISAITRTTIVDRPRYDAEYNMLRAAVFQTMAEEHKKQQHAPPPPADAPLSDSSNGVPGKNSPLPPPPLLLAIPQFQHRSHNFTYS